jgi:hypothetical protein
MSRVCDRGANGKSQMPVVGVVVHDETGELGKAGTLRGGRWGRQFPGQTGRILRATST